ncbi:DNA-polymerase III, clamp loader complex, gamma/delta/delta subunit, C-terminal [Sesbania bispinosa]|nr:DNA-polymerase III, clamp loader complex, gamma/delta/delta subunit, C-terminal [Sesbania bispinosa]
MLTRTHERGCRLTYDYVTDYATDLLGEKDLDTISALRGLLISRPVDSSFSHKNAFHHCIEHAKLWLSKAEQPIEPNAGVTYAGLREKLNKIMSSEYFTTTPEMKAPVEVVVAAAAGNYGSFQVPVHGSVVPVEVEGSDSQPQEKIVKIGKISVFEQLKKVLNVFLRLVAELALPEDKGDQVYAVAWAPNIGRLFQVRGKLYELLINYIPTEIILKRLLYELLRKLDAELKHEVCHWAAYYFRPVVFASPHLFLSKDSSVVLMYLWNIGCALDRKPFFTSKGILPAGQEIAVKNYQKLLHKDSGLSYTSQQILKENSNPSSEKNDESSLSSLSSKSSVTENESDHDSSLALLPMNMIATSQDAKP